MKLFFSLRNEKETEDFCFFFCLKGNSNELVPLYIEQTMSFFSASTHPLPSSLQYNNSNYVQTTKHACSNDSKDMGKLAHLHNNKCRFEPIESLLTFKWYKDVISKVCAYPGWLSVWMCREWSNSHVSAHPAFLSATQHWQGFVIGEVVRRGHWGAHRSGSYGRGGRRWEIVERDI